MRVEVLTTASAFRDLQAEWQHLLTQLSFQSVFFTPQWHATWWRHFGMERQLHMLTVRAEDGQLCGLAPLMSLPRADTTPRLELIGDLELCDYLDIFATPSHQHTVGQAVVDYVLAHGGGSVCLQNLAYDSPTRGLFHETLTAHGWKVETREIETCPSVQLPEDWEAYLALLRGKDRHELRRKIRRAEAAVALEYRVTENAGQLDADIDTFVALHRMSRQDAKQGFMTATKTAFFRDMAHQLWSEGWLELAFLYADGVPIAALCCFAYGTTYAAYNSGYHPDYSELSGGILLFANRLQQAIARRYTTFDFMRGNEPYKYRFGATDRPLYQLCARMACSAQESCL